MKEEEEATRKQLCRLYKTWRRLRDKLNGIDDLIMYYETKLEMEIKQSETGNVQNPG